jgi:hypothetical protein
MHGALALLLPFAFAGAQWETLKYHNRRRCAPRGEREPEEWPKISEL